MSSDISSDSLNAHLGITNDVDSSADELDPLSPNKMNPQGQKPQALAWSVPSTTLPSSPPHNRRTAAPPDPPSALSDKFLSNVAETLASPVRGDGKPFSVHEVSMLDRGGTPPPAQPEPHPSSFESDLPPRSFSSLSQSQLAKSADSLRALDKELVAERSRYDARGCASIAALLRKRSEIARNDAEKILVRIMEVKKEKAQNDRIAIQNPSALASQHGASKIAHPRWGFDNLPRRGNAPTHQTSKGQRSSEWINDKVRGEKRPGRSKPPSMGGGEAWDGSTFKNNLIDTLHNRLLMKMCFVAMARSSDIARLRKRLVVRLIKLRGLNLLRTAFAGFLMTHVRGVKLKLFCADLWGRRDQRLLEQLLKIWRSYAASKKLRHAANDWALIRHHVRRNVHRAFVRLLANRAVRIKDRVDLEGGAKWGKVRRLARAFWGLCQAASYLKSVRVRTMAFVYKDTAGNLPVAISDEVAFRACKRCRDVVSKEILTVRDEKVDHACRRAVGVGGRWGPHQLPDSLRFKNYKVVDARLGGKWVSSYVYDPLRNYLNPSVMLDDGRGAGGGTDPDGLNFESDSSEFRRTFQGLKRGFEAETTDGGRRKKLGAMLRSLDSFMSTGIAVDPQEHAVKLPGDYGGGGFKPPDQYGMNAKGKVMMLTSIDETATGASIARLVQKVFRAWVKVVGFRMLCREVFEWGRRRMLKLVWKPIWVHWRVLSAAKEVAEVEGGLRLLGRLMARWRTFATHMRAGKTRFIRRIFVRRVQFIVKAWREWARRKGKKKRVADAHWFKKGRELGFDRWHSWSVETARLKKYFNMIRVKRVARILRIRFAEWHRKIIVNRRLLRRVFQIGIEFSEHFKRLRGNREKSEFNLLRDILMAWRKTALERIRDRTLRMNLISRRMLWEASLVSRTFLGWQRHSYCAVVSREFRAEGEIRNLRRIFAGWERWSYRILRVRHKWTVRKPLEWVFCGLRLGCDVSRMSRTVILKKVWLRWESQCTERYRTQPAEFRNFWLLKHVVREWAWLVGEIGVERRCGFDTSDGFYYRPFMSKRKLQELELELSSEVSEMGVGTPKPLLGLSAIITYRNLSLLLRTFRWWSGLHSRISHLRRNLGRLSRLTLRLKLSSAFSKFPGFGNNSKVLNFRCKKLKKTVFSAWKVFSDTYVKRQHSSELHSLLRSKRNRKEALQVHSHAPSQVENKGKVESFLVQISVINRQIVLQSYYIWKRTTIINRENRIQKMRTQRKLDFETKRNVFDKWEEETHFINRRSSFGRKKVGRERNGKGRGITKPLSDKRMILMNFMNSGSGGGGMWE